MKYITVIALAALLAGCGVIDRKVAGFTGGASETCIDGVTYLQFTSGATVKVDRDGKPVAC
jgi:hypothetical protein